MLRVLVLSLGCAAALKVDQAPAVKPALRLRGGVDTSTLVKVGAGLFGLSAAQAWISPKAGMDGYGVTNAPADGLASFRGAACWQVRADPRVPTPPHLKVNLHCALPTLCADGNCLPPPRRCARIRTSPCPRDSSIILPSRRAF